MKAARLVVLGVALAAGGIAAYLAARGEPKQEVAAPQFETTEVLIARTDIGLGSAVKADDFIWQAWPAASSGSGYIRKDDRPNAVEELSGSIARAPFISGEPIRESRLIKANGSGYMAAILPAGMRAISTEISPETGAGGFILPNDQVDVILSRRDKIAEKASGVESHISETILTGVRVLAIDQTVEEKDGQRVVVGKTATLELTQRQAEMLALSRQTGTLSLALRSLVDANKKAPEIEEFNDKKAGINTVRFGVTTMTTPK